MSGTKQIHNPVQAFGYTDLQNQLGSIEVEFKAGGAIAATDVVYLDTNGTVRKATTADTPALCIGVARNAASTNSVVSVVVYGIAENCVAQGTIAAGDQLIRSATTAGAVAASATPAVGQRIGFAISASASGTVDVWVSKG